VLNGRLAAGAPLYLRAKEGDMTVRDPRRGRGTGVWVAALLIGSSILLLQPALTTGYYAEDQIHSLVRGMIRSEGTTILGHLKGFSLGTLAQGRFYPITPILARGVHYVTQTAPVYKRVLLCGTIFELILFFLLVRRWTSNSFAGLAGLLVAGLYQFRLSPDPQLGYYLQIQLVAAGLFLSLLTLDLYLEGRGKRWLIPSTLAYAMILLTYEVSITLVPIHLVVIAWRRRLWRDRILSALPFLILAVSFLAATVFVRERRSLSTDHYIFHPSLEPCAYLSAILKQMSAAIPLSYSLPGSQGLFHNAPKSLTALVGHVRFSTLLIAASISAFVASLLGSHTRRDWQSQRPSWWPVTTGVGALLVVLPTILPAASPYHQNEFRWGTGWVSILIQMHGTALILPTALWKLLASKTWGEPFGARKRLGVISFVALSVAITYHINCYVLTQLNKDRICLGTIRANLEDALHKGLLEDVPAHSVVLVAHEYPFWFGRDALWAGLNSCSTFLMANVPQPLSAIPAAARHPEATPQSHYRLQDVSLGKGSGYVILTRHGIDGDRGRLQEIRLYVRHPRLFQRANEPLFVLSESPSGHDSRAVAPFPSRASSGFRLVRSGTDWGIFSLPNVDSNLEPDRLKVVLDPRVISHLVQSEPIPRAGASQAREQPTAQRYDSSASRLMERVRR
jgi:hypothetical protein